MSDDHHHLCLSVGSHEPYVAVVRGPTAAPKVTVGAFTRSGSAHSTTTLFILEMDLATAADYARRLAEACDMVRLDQDEANAAVKQ